jgi:AAA domain
MTFNRPRPGNSIFSGRALPPQPGTFPAGGDPPPVAASPCPCDPADTLSPEEDQPDATQSDSSLPSDPTATGRRADIVRLSDVAPRPVEWLWQDRLASGTLSMLSGDPGAGKTWVALAIAAALSRGRAPFTSEALEPCTVLYASTENAGSEVVCPRFAKLGGDAARLVLLRGVVSSGSGQSTSLSLRDTPALEDALQRTHARLLIVDPLHSYFGAGADLRHSGETRPVLGGLALLAERHRCCILFVRHLSKRGAGKPIHRGPGLIELSGALRTEFLAGSSPDAPSCPALVQVKSNLGRLAPALGYRIDDAGSFAWTGLSNLTPGEMLAGPIAAGQPKRKLVAEWLRRYLQDGSRSQYTIEMAAQRDGVSIATLRRSKFDIGVHSAKDGKSGAWYWTLPPAQEDQ